MAGNGSATPQGAQMRDRDELMTCLVTAFTVHVNHRTRYSHNGLRSPPLLVFVGLQGGPKSKPLSLIIVKSYYNSPLWLDFSSILTTKWAKEYTKSVLTCFVTSSLAVFEAEIRVKSTRLIKSRLKTRKRRKCGNKRHFYIKLHMAL